MRGNGDKTFEVSSLQLLRRAIACGDQDAWAGFQRCLEETVVTWLHAHPGRETACRGLCEKHVVAQAFERFRQVVGQAQIAFETLARVLVYLRASLNGAILETLRVSQHPGAASSSWPYGEGCPERGVVWGRLQAELSNQRERRLAYLLYHCGLEPAEIVRARPQEWSDVHEVARLQRSILVRLMQSLALVSTEQEGEIQPAPAPLDAEGRA